MKTQKYIVEIEMPDGDYISAGWLQDLIECDCNVEDKRRHKVSVKEVSEGWNDAKKILPPVDTEVVCKMKGVPHIKHFICKWDGKYWWHWSDFGQEVQGWFGLNIGWEVVEWKEI